MSPSALKARNKHQVRTEETQAKILNAAQEIFSENGFEKTQLEEVAARAGYTRGAIYAHYASKEDLFLALMEQRAQGKLRALNTMLGTNSDAQRRFSLFRSWI